MCFKHLGDGKDGLVNSVSAGFIDVTPSIPPRDSYTSIRVYAFTCMFADVFFLSSLRRNTVVVRLFRKGIRSHFPSFREPNRFRETAVAQTECKFDSARRPGMTWYFPLGRYVCYGSAPVPFSVIHRRDIGRTNVRFTMFAPLPFTTGFTVSKQSNTYTVRTLTAFVSGLLFPAENKPAGSRGRSVRIPKRT